MQRLGLSQQNHKWSIENVVTTLGYRRAAHHARSGCGLAALALQDSVSPPIGACEMKSFDDTTEWRGVRAVFLAD